LNILICIGTRPEAIKMAPLYLELKKEKLFKVKVCVTAQHRELLDQVLSFFQIKPDYDLNLMKKNQSLNELSAKIIKGVDKVLSLAHFDLVMVHGDTTTSSLASLAAFHRKIRVAHIEAGLRTYNKTSPFPEELNRQMTSRIADYHFAPTNKARENLIKEGIEDKNIVVTGNTVIDALFMGCNKLNKGYISDGIKLLNSIINYNKKVILVTGHRRENFGKKFEYFCEIIKEISEKYDVQIVYPVHLNPNVQEPVNRILGGCSNISLIDPLEYPEFLYLMTNSTFIITDSGGIQEEAPSLGKPVLVTRDITERVEAIEAGNAILVGVNRKIILTEIEQLLNDKMYYAKIANSSNPYGDGLASIKIKKFLLKLLIESN